MDIIILVSWSLVMMKQDESMGSRIKLLGANPSSIPSQLCTLGKPMYLLLASVAPYVK